MKEIQKIVKIANKIAYLSAISALLFSFLFLFSACGGRTETVRKSYYLFDTQAVLCLNAEETENGVSERIFEEVETLLTGIESSLNGGDSSVAAFNLAAAGEWVELDKTAYDAFSLALEMYEYTGGLYNAGVYYCVDLWGFTPRFKNYTGAVTPYDRAENSELPDEEYVAAFQTLASCFADIKLERSDDGYYAQKPEGAVVRVEGTEYTLRVDLGGIGKGIAVDRVRELLDEEGIRYGYFSFGSSSLFVGEQSEREREWTVSFNNPRPDGENNTYFSAQLSDCTVSTGGDYENYYEVNGVRYSHIIDPRTGCPAQGGLMSASVIGGTAAEGDALATALCAMEPDSAIVFINEKLSDKKVLISYVSDGKYKVASNFQGSLTDARFSQDYKAENGKIYPRNFWDKYGLTVLIAGMVVLFVAFIGIYTARKKKNVS